MTAQQRDEAMLAAYRAACHATRRMPAMLRERLIDEAILLAANSNDSTPLYVLFENQIEAVRGAISAEEMA